MNLWLGWKSVIYSRVKLNLVLRFYPNLISESLVLPIRSLVLSNAKCPCIPLKLT
jgi:hypothetical protein